MNLSSIQTKIYDLTKTNASSYPNANMLIDLNIAYNRTITLVAQASGRWQWDDTNQPDYPVATTALIANQQDYTLDVSHLFIDRIEVLPNGGKYFYKIFPRDVEDPMWGARVTGIDTVTVGTPMKYDVTGESIFLYPIPNYSQAASLKVYFRRAQIDIQLTDLVAGTLQPGFASLFHDLLAYLVAYDYAVINMPEVADGYFAVIERKEAELTKYYAYRDHDDSPRLSMGRINYR